MSNIDPFNVNPTALLERVRQAELLPTLPAVALEVLVLTDRPDCTIDQLASTIQHDAALTARILRAINSPLFGVSKNVTSIKQASALLGMRRLRILALSFSIVKAISQTDKPDDFDYHTYWKHSLTAAVASRLIATETCIKLAEEAFVAGLLYNIGLLAAQRTSPREFKPLMNWWTMKGAWDVDDEMRYLGTNHTVISSEVLETWGLPSLLIHAVRHYRDPEAHGDGGNRTALCRLVAAGVMLAELFCGDLPCESLEECKAQCRKLTGIDAKALDALLDSLASHVLDTAKLVCVPVGKTTTYAHLQASAQEQLEAIRQREGTDAELEALERGEFGENGESEAA